MTASAEHSNDWRLELCDAALVLPPGALPGIGPRLVGATSAAAVQHSSHGYAHHGRVVPHQVAASAAAGLRGQPEPCQNLPRSLRA